MGSSVDWLKSPEAITGEDEIKIPIKRTNKNFCT
jgi:hypothetical protein